MVGVDDLADVGRPDAAGKPQRLKGGRREGDLCSDPQAGPPRGVGGGRVDEGSGTRLLRDARELGWRLRAERPIPGDGPSTELGGRLELVKL